MPEPVYIGIDPGSSGGLAAIWSQSIIAEPMPPTETDILTWLRGTRPAIEEKVGMFAIIEKVGGFIKGNPAPGSAMFKFGVGYGGLRMALIACGIPFEEVTPQTWQKALGITPREPHTKTREVEIKKGKRKGQMRTERYGGETDMEFKNRLKAKAQQLFPGEKITLAVCDALLIAEYCRRKRQGTLIVNPDTAMICSKPKQEALF